MSSNILSITHSWLIALMSMVRMRIISVHCTLYKLCINDIDDISITIFMMWWLIIMKETLRRNGLNKMIEMFYVVFLHLYQHPMSNRLNHVLDRALGTTTRADDAGKVQPILHTVLTVTM